MDEAFIKKKKQEDMGIKDEEGSNKRNVLVMNSVSACVAKE